MSEIRRWIALIWLTLIALGVWPLALALLAFQDPYPARTRRYWKIVATISICLGAVVGLSALVYYLAIA